MSAQAVQRARDTHKERREHEIEDRKARSDGRLERVDELTYTWRERARELERERLDQERRGIDPEIERRRLAKGRRDVAAEVRDQNLSRVERNRPDAINSAVQQAAETRQERNEEQTALNDPTSAEYRGLVEMKLDSAVRFREYRKEREAEQLKTAGERRIAAAHMAREARRTRMLREMEEESPLVSRKRQLTEVRALAALMSEVRNESLAAKGVSTTTPKPAERTPEQTEELIDRARRNIAAVRKSTPDPEVKIEPRGFISKVFGRKRRAA
jgi:hypothetical protein